jgi:hypothetical protein
MDLEGNRRLVRLQFELLNEGRTGEAASLWSEESLNHGRKTTPAGIKRVYESLHMLNEKHTIHEIVAEGEWVAIRTTCTGVHAAEPPIPVNGGIFKGLTPTGREYENQHLHMFRVVNGKLVEHWANRDDLGVAVQIGLALGVSPG